MVMRFSIFWKLCAVFIIVILLVLGADIIFDKVGSIDGNLLALFTFITIIALSYGASWFSVRFIKQPIHKLADSMDKLTEKEFGIQLEEDEKDEFSVLASSFNDISDMLASSEREFQKNRDYLEGILESTADIIITTNSAGKILTINSGAEKSLGYKRLDVLGKPFNMFFVNRHDAEAVFDDLKHSDSVENFDTKFVTNDGKVRYILLSLSLLRNHSSAIISIIGIGKDITKEKNLQEQLLQSLKLAAIGQVFTGVQHSMKNMLNACKGGAYMIKIGLKKDNRDMFVEGWDIVNEGIVGLTDMSLSMLKYVKEWKPKLSRVDLTETLSEVYRLIGQTGKDAGVNFSLNLTSGLPPVVCDPKMMHSVVMDIVSNAMEACMMKDYVEGEQPEVVLSASKSNSGKQFIITVQDNGLGMSDEVKENIFTPFFSTKVGSGTGLGLAITSRMVDSHHGEIVVDSKPNIGTAFSVKIPINLTNYI